jgi:hypothetical protein
MPPMFWPNDVRAHPFPGKSVTSQKPRLTMKKSDIVFILLAALLIGGAFLAFKVVSNSRGRTVVIEEGNEVVGSYSLSEDRTIPVQGPLGVSTVVIQNGVVYMADSPCANKVCIDMGRISEKGDSIICLPNRVYITIR